MNAFTTIVESVKPPCGLAEILGTSISRPLTSSQENSLPTPRPAPFNLAAVQQEAAKFREEIRRRYDTSYRTTWAQGGINE